MSVEVRQAQSVTLLSQWYAYPGGPAVAVTGLTITITPAGGGSPVVGPTSTGVVTEATGLYSYAWLVDADQAPGTYIATWAADGPVESVEAITVLEAASGGLHATTADLTAYPVTIPSGVSATRLLRAASLAVDDALLTAVYATGDDGVATETDVLTALREATCEQVAGMVAAGDHTGTGAAPALTAFTAGRISGQRGSGQVVGDAGKVGGTLYPRARGILQRAGLLNYGIVAL